jgi:hypothetical protein
MQFFKISCPFLVALKSMFVPSSHPTSAMINSVYASNNVFAFRYKSLGISWYHIFASLKSMFVQSPHPTSTMINSIYASNLYLLLEFGIKWTSCICSCSLGWIVQKHFWN